MTWENRAIKDYEKDKFAKVGADTTAVRVIGLSSLVPIEFDDIKISWVLNGASFDPQVVTYYSSGSLVATLTLSYDINYNIIDIQRT